MDAGDKYELQDIRNFPREMLYWVYDELVPVERRLPVSFWLQYDNEQQTIGLHASLLLWIHSEFQDLPREFQLTATIATMSGQDSLIDVGTGAGKTLCMVIPCLLSPDTMAIIFLPLKRLQAVQVLVFARYQIKAIAINEDTPNDPDLWKVCTLRLFVLDLGYVTETLGYPKWLVFCPSCAAGTALHVKWTSPSACVSHCRRSTLCKAHSASACRRGTLHLHCWTQTLWALCVSISLGLAQ